MKNGKGEYINGNQEEGSQEEKETLEVSFKKANGGRAKRPPKFFPARAVLHFIAIAQHKALLHGTAPGRHRIPYRLFRSRAQIVIRAQAAVIARLGIELSRCDLSRHLADPDLGVFQFPSIAPGRHGGVLLQVVE